MTDTETRCKTHDMVAAWCAICKGTDRPVTLLDNYGRPMGGGQFTVDDGAVAPRWYRSKRVPRGPKCGGCGEPVEARLVWSPEAGCHVGECCAGTS